MFKITEGKDACGQDVKIGDLVAYVSPSSHDLAEGEIVRFTPKGITMNIPGTKNVVNRRQAQVVKLPPEIKLLRLIGI